MSGLAFRRSAELLHVDMDRVQQAYKNLSVLNPLLLQYITDVEKAASIVEYHVRENRQYVELKPTWRDNILMPSESVAPMAAQFSLNDLVIGKDFCL